MNIDIKILFKNYLFFIVKVTRSKKRQKIIILLVKVTSRKKSLLVICYFDKEKIKILKRTNDFLLEGYYK